MKNNARVITNGGATCRAERQRGNEWGERLQCKRKYRERVNDGMRARDEGELMHEGKR